MRKITLAYLAKIVGYSKTTVSRVLSGNGDKYRISRDAQKLIMSVAEQENFKPKTVAQSLRNKLSCSIALVVPQISNPFFAELASATLAEAQKYDYSVMILDTQENVDLEEREVRNAIKRGVDGIILVPCGNVPGYLEDVARQIPLILADRYFPSSSISYISTNSCMSTVPASAMTSSESLTSSAVSCPLAPAFTIILFSPLGMVVISATPVDVF